MKTAHLLLTVLSGGVPAISVSPSSWDFGTTPVDTPVEKEFTILNSGNAALVITLPITSDNAAFTITTPPAVTSLAPGASTTFTAQFSGASPQLYSGNLSIVSNAAGSPTLVAITAEAYFEDNFTRANGAIGNDWNGSTFAIVSNNAVNTPTLGVELLTDPGLEAAYTAGKCDTLTLSGSPTLAQSADVHGGSKAQEVTGVAFNNRLNWPTAAGVARQWYQYSVWTKRLSGSGNTARAQIFQTNALPVNTVQSAIIDAAYTQKKLSILSTDTQALFRYPYIETGSSGFNQVVVDDGSFKALTFSSLFAMRPLGSANGVVKIKFSAVDDTYFGIVARADAQTSPDDFIMALLQRHPTYAATNLISVYLMKKVNNTYSLVTSSSFTETSNAWFELRFSGSTVSMWYNGLQVGANQTISDAEILNNGYHGMFSSGDNAITDFFTEAS